MEISICGSRNVSFIDEKTGKEINGKTYFYLFEDSSVEGYMPDKIFVNSRYGEPFTVGKWYSVAYNRYGKIDLNTVVECQHMG